MSVMAQEAIELMNILPENDQSLVLEMIKKFVKAWDPDFTKLTVDERKELELSKLDETTVRHDSINWD